MTRAGTTAWILGLAAVAAAAVTAGLDVSAVEPRDAGTVAGMPWTDRDQRCQEATGPAAGPAAGMTSFEGVDREGDAAPGPLPPAA